MNSSRTGGMTIIGVGGRAADVTTPRSPNNGALRSVRSSGPSNSVLFVAMLFLTTRTPSKLRVTIRAFVNGVHILTTPFEALTTLST